VTRSNPSRLYSNFCNLIRLCIFFPQHDVQKNTRQTMSNGAPIRRDDSLLLNVCLAIMIITDIDARNYSFPFFIAQFITQRLIIISVFIARFVAQILLNPRRKNDLCDAGSYVRRRKVLNGCIVVTLSDIKALSQMVYFGQRLASISRPHLLFSRCLFIDGNCAIADETHFRFTRSEVPLAGIGNKTLFLPSMECNFYGRGRRW